jgi:hypothetical protein
MALEFELGATWGDSNFTFPSFPSNGDSQGSLDSPASAKDFGKRQPWPRSQGVQQPILARKELHDPVRNGRWGHEPPGRRQRLVHQQYLLAGFQGSYHLGELASVCSVSSGLAQLQRWHGSARPKGPQSDALDRRFSISIAFS